MILRPADYQNKSLEMALHFASIISLSSDKNYHCKVVALKFIIRPHTICGSDAYMIMFS